ncbi:hypothetical protein GW17_00009690 [Ensete ventricosum]|nr:hypothetical protein GW17_00009690 [Ensete ventricosum]RZR76791.1 hypothetical protein BHM03_00001673 [Ensete ventricosum]
MERLPARTRRSGCFGGGDGLEALRGRRNPRESLVREEESLVPHGDVSLFSCDNSDPLKRVPWKKTRQTTAAKSLSEVSQEKRHGTHVVCLSLFSSIQLWVSTAVVYPVVADIE